MQNTDPETLIVKRRVVVRAGTVILDERERTADRQAGLRLMIRIIEVDDRTVVLFFIEGRGEQPVPVLPRQMVIDGELTNAHGQSSKQQR